MLTSLLLFLLGMGQAHPIAQYPQNSQVVAGKVVTGQAAALAGTTVYTVPTPGVYEFCSGFVVTTAGSAGATMTASFLFTAAGHLANPGIGSGAVAATTVGVTNAGSNVSACQTIYPDAGSAIQVAYTIGGSPATNPTYTYWYTVILK